MNKFIEYVKQVNLEIGKEHGLKIGEEQVSRRVVANMLRMGHDEKEIQMTLGLPANQITELICDVQANSQEYFGK